MNYWLVKTEPETYAWDDFVAKGSDHWDGVRNYAARNHLKAMQKGDQVMVYHSGKAREIVGLAEVVREHYPDPTTDDDRWVAVDLSPLRPLQNPIKLGQIKALAALQQMPLVRLPRLSVMPVSAEEFELIMQMER